MKIIDLPRRRALNGPETLAEYGWQIVPGEVALAEQYFSTEKVLPPLIAALS